MSYYLFWNTVIPYYCNGILIIIAEVMETSDAAVKEANQSEEEPQIVTDEDENRRITAAEALKKYDEVKNFIEMNGSDNLNMIFNELIENAEQIKLKKKKNKVMLEVSLDLKIHFVYTVCSYCMKKSSILNVVVVFCPKNSELYIADTRLKWTLFLGTTGVRYWKFWLYYYYGLKMSVSPLLYLFPSTARLHKLVDYFNCTNFCEIWTFSRRFISRKIWKWHFAKVYLANIFRLSNSRKFIQLKFSSFSTPSLTNRNCFIESAEGL